MPVAALLYFEIVLAQPATRRRIFCPSPPLPAPQQERAHAQRLQQGYRRCCEMASAAHARGDYATANELRMKGHEYRQMYDEERRKASRRISKRV